MREIKFRTKPIECELPNGEELYGKFVYGNLLKHKNGVCRVLVPIEGGYKNYKVATETIGQFTGLYDKNGNEIYEGDIVKWAKDNRMYVIKFLRGMFYASVEECNKSMIGGFPLHRITEYSEIVGNIYDNPELMKGGGERIIDFGGWGFIERDLTPINRKIVLSKDYANKEPQVITCKMDFSKKGGGK